jgi:hypothetical protein
MTRKIVNLQTGSVSTVPSSTFPDPIQFTWEEDSDGNVINIAPRPQSEIDSLLAVIAQVQSDREDVDNVKAIPFVNYLVTHKPGQIATRISSDIVSDGMEAVVIKLAKVLSILAKSILR